MPYNFSETEAFDRALLFTECKVKEELQAYVHYFLDLELPDSLVDPDSNSSPLDMVWACYTYLVNGGSDDVSRILFYSCRFGGKSLCESVIEVMLLLHFRGDITHLAALKRQSQDVQKYIKKFFKQPALRGFIDNDNKEETQVSFYVPFAGGLTLTNNEWRSLPNEEQQLYQYVSNSCQVIVATTEACNGKHGILCLDEIDVMKNPEAYEEAKNIPTPCHRANGDVAMPLSILTSTRKYAFGLVQNEINDAPRTGLIVKHWNLLDVTEACPKSRHQPELPKLTVYNSEELLSTVTPENYANLPEKEKEKYVKTECYAGCFNNCKMFSACKGYLATKQTSTSKFLKPIPYVQNQFRINNVDKALAQLLCRRPSTEGLVYPRLDKARHMLTPAQAYEKISGEKCPNQFFTKDQFVAWVKDRGTWCGGMDFGSSHCWAYVHGIDINKCIFITHAISASELDASQQVEHMEPFREFQTIIYPDQEDPQMIKTFKKAGFKMMKWKKGPGSVAAGISAMRLKMMPTFGQSPEFFIVRDLGEDPMIDLLFKYLQEHSWKLDAAGKPTKDVSDVNKDLPDACRYLVMNRYGGSLGISVPEDEMSQPTIKSINGETIYHRDTGMSQKIAELTGMPQEGPKTSREPMTIQPLGWYAEQNEKQNKERKGKGGGIVFDMI